MRRTANSLFLTSAIFPALILICFSLYEVSTDTLRLDLDPYWELFKRTYCKTYGDYKEETKRRILWENQVLECFMHNIRAHLGLESYTRGCNDFSDLTDEEFNLFRKGFKNIEYRGNSTAWLGPSGLGAPTSIDHRNNGLVTNVKDQRQCGACWAFSAIGSLEGQQKKKSGDLVALSEQQLIDCSTNDVNNGCNGGLMTAAFEYIKKSKGVDTEKSYPFTSRQGDCSFRPNNVAAKSTGYVELPSGDEKALLDAVASVGPISVGIDAGPRSFRTYKDGIYDEPGCSSRKLDHAVTLIGYGTEDGVDYWLVKNSWGTTWGIKGYMKIARNKNNMCGIASAASYPLV